MRKEIYNRNISEARVITVVVVVAVRVIHGTRIGETEGDTTMMALIKARQEEYKEDFGTGESKTHRRWCPQGRGEGNAKPAMTSAV